VTLLSGSQAATWMLTLGWTLVVPRRIGPHGMGLLVMAWSAFGFFQGFGSLGIWTLLVREIAADARRAPQLIGSAMLIRAVSILPCAGLAALYIRLGHFGSEQALVLSLGTGVAICSLLYQPFLAGLQAIERMEYVAYTEVINKSLLTVSGVALVLMGFGATALAASMLVAAAIVLVLNIVWGQRYFTVDWQIDPARLRALVMDSLPYWSFGIFYNIYLWIDSAMLAVMTYPAIVGWYGAPTKLFGTLMFIPYILSMAWLPRLVAAYNEGSDRLRRAARMPTEHIMMVSLPISVGAALIAGPLVTFLYGPKFAPSGPVFMILALSVAPTYFNIVASQILIACKRQAIWTWALAVACVVNPVLNLFLIQATQQRFQNGAIGAAVSYLLTELLLVGIGLVVVRPYLYRETGLRLGRSAVATVGMAIIVSLVGPLGLVLQVLAGMLTFGVLALFLRVVSIEEIPEVERLLGRFAIVSWVRRLWAW
jgi:O-antigen/teichoic acid export membrane protein